MGFILNIDTATEHASVCISNNGQLLAMEESHEQKNHGSFLQPAIKKIMLDAGLNLSSLDAIAVTKGPGSYTGLRVGMASAKGLCYALNKPLILLNTLQVMAAASISNHVESKTPIANLLFCPMIDARRMEVFTALYNDCLEEVLPPMALILTEESFATELDKHVIVFSGSGLHKLKNMMQHTNAQYDYATHTAANMIALSEKMYLQKEFAHLAYSEPYYIKEFFSPAPKQ